jgi:hypothetical protein
MVLRYFGALLDIAMIKRTDDDDIQYQDNESEDASAGAILPSVAVVGGHQGFIRDGSGEGQGGQPELSDQG